MNYFFHSQHFTAGQIIILSSDESHHAMRVLRLSKGSEIALINGMGQKAHGLFHENEGKLVKVLINIVEQQQPAAAKISVALALLKKKERLEWFMEKALELGANEIIIFNSEHTEKKKADDVRLQKIALSALKQSGNLWMPEIRANETFGQIVKKSYTGQKFIAHCEDGAKTLLKHACKAGEDALILIGPEGDFSSKEISEAIENNYVPVSLGDLRLRAETAAITALITMQLSNQ